MVQYLHFRILDFPLTIHFIYQRVAIGNPNPPKHLPGIAERSAERTWRCAPVARARHAAGWPQGFLAIIGKSLEIHGKMQEITYKWKFIAGKHIDGGFDGRSNDGIPKIRGNLMVPRIFQHYSHYIFPLVLLIFR